MTTPRHVGLAGATGIGLGAMLGAGVFSVWGPATAQAGPYLLWAIALAGAVALINAVSTAQLASYHPVAGGAYTYGRRELHPGAGFLAGIGFVVGKTASVAAIALVIGLYLWPAHSSMVATIAIAAAWALNARGVTRTARVATAMAITVIVGLTAIVVTAQAVYGDGGNDVYYQPVNLEFQAQLTHPAEATWGTLGGAALIFFAFAGYARIATLGEEVDRPERTIPFAIVLALAAVLVVYVAVGTTALTVLGPGHLTTATLPMGDLVDGTWIPRHAVSLLIVVAAFGSLVALMAGVGRTAMAMARESDLPSPLARQSSTGAPALAEGIGAVVAVVLVWVGDLTFAIAMSSFAVLVYYAVANLSAMAARRHGHVRRLRVPMWISGIGALASISLAVALPWPAVALTAGLMVAALAARAASFAVTEE